MTKALTGTAAMQLVEQGRLELDRPAADWVPELSRGPGARRLRGRRRAADPAAAAPDHAAPPAYPHRRVLVTRSGARRSSATRRQRAVPGIITCQNAALNTPLLFDPGERWEYGINIDWAGKMVEAVSGRRLGAYMQENIFEPLGMRDTAFKLRPDMRARLAKIHQRGEDEGFTALDLEIPQEPEFDMGGGGLYGTVGDYLKFVRMILNRGAADGQEILQPETVDMMARNQMGECRVRAVKTAMPPLSNDAEFFPGMPKTWGLTFMINTEQAPTGRTAGSLAWAGLANSYYWIDPKKGVGGVYLTQILPFADKKSLPLFFEFEKAVYRQLS